MVYVCKIGVVADDDATKDHWLSFVDASRPPGSRTTALARQLAVALARPLIAKYTIKQVLSGLPEIRLGPRLVYFLAVIDCDGVGKAAGALELSQATWSAAIHGLEAELGLPLFHRVGRRLLLTVAGEDPVPVAREAVAAVEAAEATARALRSGHVGTCTITATASTSFFPLSDMMAVALRDAPALSVRVVNTEAAADALQLLNNGSVELALVPGPAAISRGMSARHNTA